MNRALFLDRDGVIIENRADYVRRWEDVEFIEGALRALAVLSQAQIKVILVTNQSAVGRGMISMEAALLILERILK
ncbi:MAG TPA: HAD-IIIA family hydrolase, partial [Anaerolineaceae bacterium]|nr:HAD-IIIA family hydrolase [Anaerolineaceae bacterium]